MTRLATTLALVVCGLLTVAAAGSELVVRDVYLMGTRAQLAAWAHTRSEGLDTIDRALRVLEDTEAQLSTWRDDSVISRLNRQPVGQPFHLPHELCDTFAALFRWRAATARTFDPAIGRLTDVWGIHAGGRVPPTSDLRQARAASGLDHFDFDQAACRISRRTDATIDVGAFGKGDAIDRVARRLSQASWMIDLGGQVAVHGVPPDTEGWSVGIAHPRVRDRELLTVSLREGSLSTSAGSERDIEVEGRRVGHILDPRSGEPALFDGSVSVWHQSALAADILSTALYVMGPDEGIRFAERLNLAALYLLPEVDGTVRQLATSPFRRLLTR